MMAQLFLRKQREFNVLDLTNKLVLLVNHLFAVIITLGTNAVKMSCL